MKWWDVSQVSNSNLDQHTAYQPLIQQLFNVKTVLKKTLQPIYIHLRHRQTHVPWLPLQSVCLILSLICVYFLQFD